MNSSLWVNSGAFTATLINVHRPGYFTMVKNNLKHLMEQDPQYICHAVTPGGKNKMFKL